MKIKTLKIKAAGDKAIQAALAGAPLYVLSPQEGPVPAGPRGLERAQAAEPHARWIYVTLH